MVCLTRFGLHPGRGFGLEAGTSRNQKTNDRIETMNTNNLATLGNIHGGALLTEANEQWRSRPADQRYETLTALRDAVVARRERTRAFDVDLTDLRAKEEDGGLVFNSGIAPARPSHWAFGQLSGIVGAPASYLRRLPTELAARCINTSLDQYREDRDALKVMTVEGDDIDTMQAVTSRTYGRIWDADVVEAVDRIVDRSGGRFFNPKDWSGEASGLYASDHDVFCFMIDGGSIVDGGGERDRLNRGFFVWNSETGARTFGLMTFLFRVVCGNHLVWDAQDVSRMIVRHSSGGPARFDREAMPALLSYVNASAKPAEDAIAKAKGMRLIDLVNIPGQTVANETGRLGDEWQKAFAAKFDFRRAQVRDAVQFARAEEGRCETLWDLINGFTASARSIEYADARIELETRAGKLMALAR